MRRSRAHHFLNELQGPRRELVPGYDLGDPEWLASLPVVHLFVVGEGQDRNRLRPDVALESFERLERVERLVIDVEDHRRRTERAGLVGYLAVRPGVFERVALGLQGVPEL